MSEKNEPRDVEQNGAEEKHRIDPSKLLTATLYRHQREERNRQVDEQHPIVLSSERSHERARNLKAERREEYDQKSKRRTRWEAFNSSVQE